MGAAQHLEIRGAKGGGSKPKQPTEAPDSLQSTNLGKMLIAVGEGEFEETPTDEDIFFDNTPIADASGNVNFPNVKWDWRSGSIEQSYIPGIPAIENETTVNVELRSDNPWSRALSNIQLSAVRLRFSWPRLASQDEGGNTNGYRIEYAIDVATDGGAYQQMQLGAVDGKTTNGYQRSVRVDLPKATSGWMIRVRRITPNQNSGTIADTMTIAGYTEIIDRKLRYPNTALLYIEFDAQQFQNIPAVTVKCKARKWPVPANYDPLTRTYTGVWDGTFKQAWTNNPAFVTYGLCVEDRFGLGKRIKPWMVDKWEMYRIAQYCDQLVPDGIGGQEPRFLCDLNLQGRAEAWTLLRDLSAIYRGMVYWAQGSLFMQADMPRAQDIDYVFTRSNVIDGEFTYGGAEKNTHYSRALVSYDNPANNYDTDVIPVTDLALQRRYRDRPIEISAIGCTRASEAQRRGKWILLSNSQDRTVTFKTGMEGRIPLPGHVIPVADELIAGRPNGGRIAAAAGRVVTLDRDTQIKAGDRLIINLPNGRAQGRTVESVSGRAVTVTTAYSVAPEPELQWAIDADDLAIQLFRVLRTVRTVEGDYEITALEFNPSKFAHIDTGARLEERPISVIPITVVPPPASVALTSSYAVDQGIAVSTMTIAWPAVNGAVAYDVEWRKDSGNWIKLQRTGATSVDVTGIYAGAYLARVRAVSAFDISSIWKSSSLTQLTGKAGLPPAVSLLNTTPLVYGIKLAWGFPAGAEDTQRTEIWYSKTTSRDDAIKLGDFAYPQAEHEMHGLAGGVSFFFWARLIDRTGNIGPWFPAGVGVNGQSSSEQSEYEEYFKDKIGNGALYPELREEIALISGPPTLPGSVNNRLKEINDQLQEQIDAIGDVVDALEYDPAKAYALGDNVRQGQRLYVAIQAVPAAAGGSNAPPNPAYWLDIGQVARTENGTAARVTVVETKVTEQDGKLTAQAQRIDGVQSSLDGKADASTVNTLANRVTQTEQGLTSQGSSITGLTNSLQTTDSKVTAAQQAVQALSNTVSQQGNTITSQGTAITQIKSSIGQQPDNLVLKGNFEDGIVAPWGAATTTVVATTAHPSAGKAIAFYEASFCGQDQNILTAPGEQFDLSADVYRAEMTAGQTGSFQLRFADKNGLNLGYFDAFTFSAGGGFQTFKGRITAPAGAASARFVSRLQPAGGRALWCNIVGRRVTAADSANAEAVSSLSSTVTQQGTTITSQGQAITNLTSRVTSAEGVNSAQAQAISQLDTNVTQQGDQITAQATRLDGLYVQVNPEQAGTTEGFAGSSSSSVGVWSEQSARIEDGIATGQRIDTVQAQAGEANASVQMLSEVVAGVDGKVSAQSTWKTETNSNGKKVATGIVQGSNGEVGEILLSAQRVAIIDGINGVEGNLFVFQNGQLFVNQAFISQAFIKEIVLGMTLRSAAVNSQGLPLLEINVPAGTLTLRGQTADGSVLLNNYGLYVYDLNYIERTGVGRMT